MDTFKREHISSTYNTYLHTPNGDVNLDYFSAAAELLNQIPSKYLGKLASFDIEHDNVVVRVAKLDGVKPVGMIESVDYNQSKVGIYMFRSILSTTSIILLPLC